VALGCQQPARVRARPSRRPRPSLFTWPPVHQGAVVAPWPRHGHGDRARPCDAAPRHHGLSVGEGGEESKLMGRGAGPPSRKPSQAANTSSRPVKPSKALLGRLSWPNTFEPRTEPCLYLFPFLPDLTQGPTYQSRGEADLRVPLTVDPLTGQLDRKTLMSARPTADISQDWPQ
jgi:hypothetical protein